MFTLLFASQLAAQPLAPEEIYDRALPSVATLYVEDQSGEREIGTAFLALGDDVAVTAWHLVAHARTVTARFADNEFVCSTGLVDKNETNDVALIHLPTCGRPQAKLNTGKARVGSRAYVIGAPRGYEFSIADGLISQVQSVGGNSQYQISCPISGGNSGGPLLNAQGEVIGVADWSMTGAQNLNFAVQAARLSELDAKREVKPWAEVAQQPVAVSTQLPEAKPTAEAVAERAEGEGLAQFKQALQEAAGEEVTIMVLRNNRMESFKFVAPAESSEE